MTDDLQKRTARIAKNLLDSGSDEGSSPSEVREATKDILALIESEAVARSKADRLALLETLRPVQITTDTLIDRGQVMAIDEFNAKLDAAQKALEKE